MKIQQLMTEFWIWLNVTLMSLFLLPGIIYLVGGRLFGSYRGGLAGFYSDQLRGLTEGQVTAWIITMTPSASLLLIRLLFIKQKENSKSRQTT